MSNMWKNKCHGSLPFHLSPMFTLYPGLTFPYTSSFGEGFRTEQKRVELDVTEVAKIMLVVLLHVCFLTLKTNID